MLKKYINIHCLFISISRQKKRKGKEREGNENRETVDNYSTASGYLFVSVFISASVAIVSNKSAKLSFLAAVAHTHRMRPDQPLMDSTPSRFQVAGLIK